MKIRIVSTSRELVGDVMTVKAEIYEPVGQYHRVKDIIELEIEGGARLSDEDVIDKIKEAYNGSAA
jgi:hypothetical protein